MYRTRFVEKRFMTMTVALAVPVLAALVFTAIYLAGCTDTLDGETFGNQKPLVYFANIPPEGQRTGRNLEVFWYGTDRDGLIDYYRYHVVTIVEVGGENPADYILKVPDTAWTYVGRDEIDTTWWQCLGRLNNVCVDSVQACPPPEDSVTDLIRHIDTIEADLYNPHTKNTIVMSADLRDPVNVFVSQWVFLQAFDMEGLGSDIVYRLFSRNDYPPETGISDFSLRVPFVDGDPGGVVTGVWMNWFGLDPVDYPGGDFPPLEFEWRLYGPYTDSVFRELVDTYIQPVFVGRNGKVYNIDDTAFFCDTFPDLSIVCETIHVTENTENSAFGRMEDKFLVDDSSFIIDTTFNKMARSSQVCGEPWVDSTRTTIYNVYANHVQEPDTTVEMWFMFWVRSRDDAFVADLIPSYDSFTVISPRYERDVAVIDFTGTPAASVSIPTMDVRLSFWKNAIERWRTGVNFDTTGAGGVTGKSPDYLDVRGEIPLRMLLKHKVAILYDDNVQTSGFPSSSSNVYKAIEAGVNIWLTMRAPLEPGSGANEAKWEIIPSADYLRYFGVRRMVYSGWIYLALQGCPPICWPRTLVPCVDCVSERVEDFVGTYALDSLSWPNLDVDTELLQTRFIWFPGGVGWDCCLEYKLEHPALPEVDWSVRMPQTEALYLYKSFYTDSVGGGSHPRGGNYNMEGNPVAQRLATSLYRTAHFNFTPLAIDTVQMQIVIDSLLNWLHDPTLSSATSKTRYPDAAVKASTTELRERYLQRIEEEAQKRSTLMNK
jgi:hypothetical protein